MIENLKVGVRETYDIIFRAKNQSSVHRRAMFLDFLGGRLGRGPIFVPSVVDGWPEAPQDPLILMVEIRWEFGEQELELGPILPGEPRRFGKGLGLGLGLENVRGGSRYRGSRRGRS